MLKRYVIFAGGSALGALIDYVVTLASVWLAGADPVVALGLAMIASASTTFLFHERVTFPGARSRWPARYALFMSWSALIFAMRALLLRVSLAAGLPLYAALCLAIGLVSLVNFAMSRRVIFARSQP